MADIYFPEDMKAYVYKWAEKEISDTVVNGTVSTFSLNNTISNILGIGTTPIPDYQGTTGFAVRDLAVYYRKNGADSRVDEAAIVTCTGTTVQFAAAVGTETADYIVVSYAYTDSTNKTTFTCSVKDWDKSGGEADSEVENTIGGCSYKKKLSPSLIEISLTAIKNGIWLSQAANGDMINTTTEVSGKTIKTTTQTSNRTPRAIVIKGSDPTNTSVALIMVARNVDGISADHSGGAEDSWEESCSFKTDQQNYAEIEVQ